METAALDRAREAGCVVAVVCGDVSKREDVDRAVSGGSKEFPGMELVGIVHGALVLDDAGLGKMSDEQWERVIGPRVRGGWHLHCAAEAGRGCGALCVSQ